jgi:hypothetical protein
MFRIFAFTMWGTYMTPIKKRFLIAFGTCILLFPGFQIVSSADTLVMPRELVDFAHANGCTPINDFFERPGMVNPPYVYGWLPGPTADSAAFWCKKVENNPKPYKLIFKVPDSKQLEGCPAVVEWLYPRGLSVETRRNLELRSLGFRYVTAPKRVLPTNVVANARVLVSEYDGLQDIFYCYKGEWLVASLE